MTFFDFWRVPERMGLGREDLFEDISGIGVDSGDCLALGISLKSIGWIDVGPEALIDALLEAVGDDGTLMIPTFTRLFPLPIPKNKRGNGFRQRWGGLVPWDYVFDPDTTPPETGAVSAAMWRREGSVRSRHPSHSVVAIGRLARFLTDGHDENSSAFQPYARLAKAGGKGLFIGLGGRLVSLRHQGQLEAGLLNILPPTHGVRFRREDGSIGIYRNNEWGCTLRLPDLNEDMIEKGLIVEGNIGEAESMLVDAAGVVGSIAGVLSEDPSLNLCQSFNCLWCRELERRFDLYPRIRNPAIFQRSKLLRKVSFMLNEMRKRNSIWAYRAADIINAMIDLVEGRTVDPG